jgi:tetratricopeptide (TPR) repeat protein
LPRTTRNLQRALACALLSFAFACTHQTRAFGPDGKPVWLEVQSPNFTLRAATTEPVARRAAQQLERIRAGLLASSWHADNRPLGHVEAILLSGQEQMHEQFHFPHVLQGMAFGRSDGPLRLLANADDDPDQVPILKHELSHAIAHGFLLREPLWLAEGLACYLETLELDADSVTVGRVSQERLAQAARSRLSLAEVLSETRDLYSQHDEQRVTGFYARAWLLVHLLINRHRAGFEDLLLRLARAEEPAAAFAAAFPGLDPHALEVEAADYIHGGSYLVARTPLPPREVPLVVRVLTPGETAIAEAQTWQMASWLRQQFREEAQLAAKAALAAAPGDPAAVEVWAQVVQPKVSDRVEAARTCARLSPAEPRAWQLLVEALAEAERPEDGLAKPLSAEAERATLEANRLAPTDPFSLLALSALRLSQQKAADALVAAREANRLLPGQAAPIDAVAVALAASGDCEGAVRAEQRVLEVLPDETAPESVASVQRRVAALGASCRAMVKSLQPPVQPKRLRCANALPRLPLSKAQKGLAIRVKARLGKGGEVLSTASDGSAAGKALEAYVRSCSYAPAIQAGDPIEVDLTEVFSLQ